jgi:hypothetical protein
MKHCARLSLAVVVFSFFLFSTAAMAGQVKVQILSATIKDKKIAGASVTLQRNGETSVSAVTNAQGLVLLNTNFADDRSTLMIVKKPDEFVGMHIW